MRNLKGALDVDKLGEEVERRIHNQIFTLAVSVVGLTTVPYVELKAYLRVNAKRD
jgi:hypothetical protein